MAIGLKARGLQAIGFMTNSCPESFGDFMRVLGVYMVFIFNSFWQT